MAMSTPSSPSLTMATQMPSSNSLGTGFLDLPPELRKMIYDLIFEDWPTWKFPLPGDPRPVVPGINLLRVCRQIYNERSDYIWRTNWMIYFPLGEKPQLNTSSMNCTYAMSCLHSAALAKLQCIVLVPSFHQDLHEVWGPVDLKVLCELKSLFWLYILVQFGDWERRVESQTLATFEESPFLTGFVIQILSQVPASVRAVAFSLSYYDTDGKSRQSDALEALANKYEALRGSFYVSEGSSPSDTISISP